MQLTQKQEEGLNLAIERFQQGEKFVVISGYAGTGKSTLVQHIISAIGVPQEQVVYTAYTGKATLVLSRKGCMNTSTLHKLLYKAIRNARTGEFTFAARPVLSGNYKIVVVDEVSMVPEEMWTLLLSHNVYVIALGDPGQLGPIKSDKHFAPLRTPHVFLDQIMRQAEHSEIIKLSMEVRKGSLLDEFSGTEAMVLNKNDLSVGMLFWADQVLCATNATREQLNTQMREIKGLTGAPQIGDKIICLRNYWKIYDTEGQMPLTNGTIGYITSIRECTYNLLRQPMQVYVIDFETEWGATYQNVVIDKKLIDDNETTINKNNFTKFVRGSAMQEHMPKEFVFGYAITTWKAQGSEWDKVLLIEEKFPFKVDEHKRYLYTGITRASEKVVVIRNA